MIEGERSKRAAELVSFSGRMTAIFEGSEWAMRIADDLRIPEGDDVNRDAIRSTVIAAVTHGVHDGEQLVDLSRLSLLQVYDGLPAAMHSARASIG